MYVITKFLSYVYRWLHKVCSMHVHMHAHRNTTHSMQIHTQRSTTGMYTHRNTTQSTQNIQHARTQLHKTHGTKMHTAHICTRTQYIACTYIHVNTTQHACAHTVTLHTQHTECTYTPTEEQNACRAQSIQHTCTQICTRYVIQNTPMHTPHIRT